MILKNSRHEKFSQLVARGMEKTKAYRTVYPRAVDWSQNAARVQACRLAKKCAARIRELQEIPAKATIASRTEIAEFLTRVIRTPIAQIDETSDLAQEKTVRTLVGEEEGTVEKIKIPDKLGAADGLRKLMGYDEPEKTEHKVKFEPDDDIWDALGGRKKKP